jgi:hypothetical protein
VKISVDELLSEVAARENCDVDDIEWYSWPEAFGATAGPSGVGGATVTRYQVYAFSPPSNKLQKYCAGQWRHWNGELNQKW